ncbi:Leucinostatins biosynthesis cluster protein T [Drechslerella dactyloides]|uniref:Leucinostatins biosynthesis cluster protein T n=1 Tax=Drechslerella dactyloides TaxID=74499 RepID=A0AAD6NMS2_DREDA|nr:Leucinostatins biosynthesis cluster protein T [Drechslerella dactyloides]
MSHIIITGATGLAGSAVLQSALSSPAVSKISILSRRPVPAAEGNPKANVIIHKDFTSYPPDLLSQLSGASGCIWAQGISSVGMKEDEYTTITKTYPLAAAEAFSTLPGNFNFIYISGRGANQEGKAGQMFGRVKGAAEKALLDVAAQKEGFSAYNLRPAGIDPGKTWTAERKQGMIEKTFFAIAPVIRPFASGLFTPADKLAEVSIQLALGDGGKITGDAVLPDGYTLENPAIRRLAGLDCRD